MLEILKMGIIMVGEYGLIKMEELRREPIKTEN